MNTSIAGIELKSYLYNASGCLCTTEEELTNLYNSSSGALITKSATFSPREGNPKPRYYEDQYGSINSMGLPNKGYRFYSYLHRKFVSENKVDKPFIYSVSGIDQTDLLSMLSYIDKQSPVEKQLVEVNLSCPNIPGKAQTAYDFPKMDKCLKEIFNQEYTHSIFGLKLSPYFDPAHIRDVSSVIEKYPVKFITCCNSLGNGLIIDPKTNKPCIVPKNGLGGIGGIYCKPTCLANVYQFQKTLGHKLDIIGCGGISTGRDVYDYILCGAKAVQIGSQFMKDGVDCFDRIVNEFSLL